MGIKKGRGDGFGTDFFERVAKFCGKKFNDFFFNDKRIMPVFFVQYYELTFDREDGATAGRIL